jgi:acyl-coenzyme A thioesterase PaaI-like protein
VLDAFSARVSAIATAARFSSPAGSAGTARVNAAQSAAIFRLVVSSKGLMTLDYTTAAPDEMTAMWGNGNKNMIDKAAAKLKSDGWSVVEATGFIQLIGPLWQRPLDGTFEYALATQDKHHNRRGLVQGGVLMTFADRTCGMTARHVTGKQTMATIQLDVHFVEAGKIGEILISRPRVVRATRSLVFVNTEVTVDKRCIAMANGVFKILKSE